MSVQTNVQMSVLIIGGTSGIGLGLARHYWEQGARVAICGRHPDKLDGVQFARDSRVSVHACDIADRAAVARVVAEVTDAAGGIDLLIVTAGQYTDAKAEESKDSNCTISVVPTLAPSMTASAGTRPTRPEAANELSISAVAVLLRPTRPEAANELSISAVA
eukprot:gene37377-42335_t